MSASTTLGNRLGSFTRDAPGSVTLELAVLTPVLLVLLGLVIAGGRISIAGGAVEQAATAAAREASLARDPASAVADATRTARDALDGSGLACTSIQVSVDTAGFARPPGTPAQVGVEISCTVGFSDLAVPGLPGSRVIHARAVSVLDTYRSRSIRP